MKIIKPHKKKSRKCTAKDIERILSDSTKMIRLCSVPLGKKTGAFAIAHCQITDDDPLRFFVTKEGFLFINPEIINHTEHLIDSVEGCMSYPNKDNILVKRYNKIEVKYNQLSDDKSGLTDEIKTGISGKLSKIFQHEVLGHFEGETIYD